MDIGAYLRPLLKWWWLILAAAVIAGVASFIAAAIQPDIYQSRTTLMVGRFILDPNPESGQIYTAQQLAGIYVDIANRDPIQAATMEALDVNWMPSYNVRVLPNTQIIEITVSDTVPERAQIFATELATQIISYTPTSSSFTGANRQVFIENQLDLLQTQILRTQSEIDALQQQLGEANSAREISDTNSKISIFESKLYSLQTAYADLLANTQEGASNTIQLLEPANLPRIPVGPNKLFIVIPALMVGVILASGAAFLLEYLNKSLDSVSDIQRELPLPLLGEIPALSKKEHSWTYIDKDPLSIFSEAFRKLRTNIEISTKGRQVKSILVSSAAEGDGKTTVATNLAFSYSLLGKSVILIDADFRRHRIHEVLGLRKEHGISELLSKEDEVSGVIQHWKDNVSVISSGKHMNNATELLSSDEFPKMISSLKEHADIIIIDGPPFFLSETSSVSTAVDGLLLVVPIGSSKDIIRPMKKQLDMINSNILGLVVNLVRPTSYYGYYYASYADEAKSKKDVKAPSLLSSLARTFNGRGKRTPSISPLKNNNSRTTKSEKSSQQSVTKEPVVDTGTSQNQPLPKKEIVEAKAVNKSEGSENFLGRAIFNSSARSVEKDKEQLRKLARKKQKSDK